MKKETGKNGTAGSAEENVQSPSMRVSPNCSLDDDFFMELALEEAKLAAAEGEVPIGAIVIYHPIDKATQKEIAPPKVIAKAHNLRETKNDPSAHAEFIAMIDAAKHLDRWRLSDCTVYVTLEPCIMCAGLMQQSRIARCVFGASDPKGGALGSLYRINSDERLNHRFVVEGGVLESDCAQLLTDFFKERRKSKESNEICAGNE